NEHLTQGDPPTAANTVFRAYRYDPDYPGLEGQDLTPGNYLELSPDSSHCPVITSLEESVKSSTGYTVFPNPAKDHIKVTSHSADIRNLTLYNVWGQQMNTSLRNDVDLTSIEIDLQGVPTGIYLLQIETRTDIQIVRVI